MKLEELMICDYASFNNSPYIVEEISAKTILMDFYHENFEEKKQANIKY